MDLDGGLWSPLTGHYRSLDLSTSKNTSFQVRAHFFKQSRRQ